jgi:hypothetical protein
MFSQPSAGSDFKAADHLGHLLLIYPREIRTGIVTKFGVAEETLACDLVVLTDPSGPRAEPQVLLFQKALIGSLRANIGGEPVLARLGQGTAKSGQSAPYILNPYDEQDAVFATHYLNSVGGNPFQTAPSFQQAPVPPAAPAAHAALPQAALAPVHAPLPHPAPAAAAVPAPQPVYQQMAPQQIPQPAPAAAAPMITLPNGQQVTPETAAALAQLGMSVPPPPPST